MPIDHDGSLTSEMCYRMFMWKEIVDKYLPKVKCVLAYQILYNECCLLFDVYPGEYKGIDLFNKDYDKLISMLKKVI